jgi:hypothetical protein
MSDNVEIQELNDDDLEAASGGAPSFCCCSTTGGNCSNDTSPELEAAL